MLTTLHRKPVPRNGDFCCLLISCVIVSYFAKHGPNTLFNCCKLICVSL